jgi:hypothetical protein
MHHADILLFLLVLCIVLLFSLCRMHGSLRWIIGKRPELALSFTLFFCFFVAYFLWVRAIDYLWPVSLLLILQLVTLTPAIEEDALRSLRMATSHASRISWVQVAMTLILLNFVSVATAFVLYDRYLSPRAYDAIRTIPAGSRALNIDWDLFPVLFFLNDAVQYARGMDPSYDYYHDPAAFALLDAPNDRWSLARFREFPERFNVRNWTLQVERETENFDTAPWVQSLREKFDADFLVLRKSMHPLLVGKLRALPDLPLHAESRSLVIFSL